MSETKPSHYAMIPHMDDDDLDPYEYRLLGHYRRVCGVNGGTCTQSTRTLAEKTKISLGKISQARKRLEALGRIQCQYTKKTVHVTLVDVWAENKDRYKDCSPDEQPCSLHERVHEKTPEKENSCSPHEQECSPGETKNEESKNDRFKKISQMQKDIRRTYEEVFNVTIDNDQHPAIAELDVACYAYSAPRVLEALQKAKGVAYSWNYVLKILENQDNQSQGRAQPQNITPMPTPDYHKPYVPPKEPELTPEEREEAEIERKRLHAEFNKMHEESMRIQRENPVFVPGKMVYEDPAI